MTTPLIICTIIAKNYLAHARVLMQSVAQHQPEAQRVVLLVDEIDDYFNPAQEEFTLLLARDLEIAHWPHMALRYDIMELNTAVKPFLLEHLFETYQAGKVIYLDPDIVLFNPLTAVLHLLETHTAVLTPHILQPLEDDYHPSELDLLRVGTYNLGFFAISRRGVWQELLRWWQEKLYHQSYNDIANGLFVDQKWMDFAPSLFDGIAILRDPTYNIAYWNFKQRHLTQTNAGYTVNGQPLTFFHFSGFDRDDLEQVSRHQNRHHLRDLPVAFHRIMADYAQRLQAHGYADVRHWPYVYGLFGDGVPITTYHRDCLRQHDPLAQRWPDPFSMNTPDNFRDWCVQPQSNGLLSPYLRAFYADRADLQQLFPRIDTTDALAFAVWFCAQDSASTVFHPHVTQPIRTALASRQTASTPGLPSIIWRQRWQQTWQYYRDFPQQVQPFIPKNALDIQTEFYTGPGGLYGGLRQLFKRLGVLQMLRRLVGLRVIMTVRFFFTQRPQSETRPENAAFTTLERGVNVIGYMQSESGIGQAARNVLHSLQTTDFAVGVVSLNVHDRARQQDRTSKVAELKQYALNIFHVNADTTFQVREALDARFYQRQYNIGFWFWELEQFPAEWERCFSVYDEIWVATSFVQRAIAATAPIPVVRVPLPVELTVPEAVTRSALNLPEAAFLCLFIFDAHSIFERKNPLAVVEAFRLAFSAAEYQHDVRLVIKVNNLKAYPAEAEKLSAALQAVNGILLDTYLTRAETYALLNLCDVYVSLHRSEGYGLTIAEAMYLGKPVIATAYSGNMDFMTVDNSYPVPYQLVELAQDYPPYKAGNVWAQPDTTAAARLLRQVYTDRAEAHQRGQRAADDLRKYYSAHTVGQQIQARLTRILRQRSGAGETSPGQNR